MKLFYKIIFALSCLAIAFWGLFELMGSHVDEHGILHEPFFLLPLAWGSLFLAGLLGMTYTVLRFVSYKETQGV